MFSSFRNFRPPAVPEIMLYNNIISAEPGAEVSKEKKHIEPIEMKRLWFDVTQLLEELHHAFD